MATKTPQEESDSVEVVHTNGWRYPMNCSVCNNATNKFVFLRVRDLANLFQICVCVHCLEELLEKAKA